MALPTEVVRARWSGWMEERNREAGRKRIDSPNEEESKVVVGEQETSKRVKTSEEVIVLDDSDELPVNQKEKEKEKEKEEQQEEQSFAYFVAEDNDDFVPFDAVQLHVADGNARPPWMASSRAHYESLAQELEDFGRWVAPTRREIDLRRESIARLQVLVAQTFGEDENVTCHNFGSFFLGLFLPGSDLDFVIMGARELAGYPLRKLANSLRNKAYTSSLDVIENTRVPLVKYTDVKTGIECDISFDQEGGLVVAACFSRLLQQEPLRYARPLTLLIKYWLRGRGLHQPYSGGLGSYSVLILVVSLIQHQQTEASTLESLFLRFFEFYGNEFNWVTTGVSILEGGSFFSKAAKGAQFENALRPALEDPIDKNNNVGFATRNLGTIVEAMRTTFKKLQEDYSKHKAYGVLASIFSFPHSERIH